MAVTPVVVGASLAWAEGAAANWPVFVLTLACAVLIQVGTNLLNDVSDFEKGNDRADRVGPLRVTAAGWATPSEVRRAAGVVFGLAMVIGVVLVWLGGLVILGLGLFSIVAGWAYSGGSRPVSHGPFGELFVLMFFGLVAVGGSHYLQAGQWSPLIVPAGLAIGIDGVRRAAAQQLPRPRCRHGSGQANACRRDRARAIAGPIRRADAVAARTADVAGVAQPAAPGCMAGLGVRCRC